MATAKKNVVDIKPDVSAQIEVLRADMALLAKTVKTQAKTTAQEKTAQVIDTAETKAAEAKEKYAELTTSAEKSIRENPLTSVAIAAGVGVLFGLLTRK